ncbi:MAG: glycerol-3-phosphate acyltransferase [Chloroflexi bacterium]|nr:glycerol-3-phosphate acyltransferase [Chloroflexota bacterium]
MIVTGVTAVIIGYLLGAIPFAFIIGRFARGIDIRQVGTRNVGAMNTVREIGVAPGLTVLLLDMAKGSLAVVAARLLAAPGVFVFAAGMAAVAGHNWPVFLRFRGGRGAATTLGVLLAVTPAEFGLSFVVVLAVFLFTWSSGLAVGAGLALLPVIIWASGREASYIIYPLVLAVFLVLRNVRAIRDDLSRTGSWRAFVFKRHRPFWRGEKR